VAILLSLVGWFGNKLYKKTNRLVNLFTMISAHTQLLIGLCLYFVSPLVTFSKQTMTDPTTRYWTVEHISMMIFAIILITVGHSRSKRTVNLVAKHRSVAIYYSLALLVIVLAIIQSMRPFFGVSA
jgi:hypothetical protein